MKETKFIEQNKSKWSEFENLLNNKTKDPDRLSDLYVQITDDLSYSKTYYKNRLVRAYLNNISQKIYLSIYKNKKAPLNKLVYFWKEELPFIIYQCRKELFLSFVIFFLAAAIGALSVINDPSYAEIVTSPSYVSMTKENIKNGDPMAVYKDEDPLNMSLRIAWNNVRVSFYVFVLGVFACVGSIFMLIINGTMLGGFQFFFFDKGVFLESVITVWQHGTIEILCIVIAGGAGIVLGRGLIAPGSYPRLQSFQIAARKGLMIMIAVVPFLIVAAFIEGFITRLTEAPLVFRGLMIAISLLVMFGYFVFYPYRKFKEGFDSKLKYERPVENKPINISFSKIKDASEVFADSFSIYTSNFSSFLLMAIFVGVVYGGIHLYYLTPEVYFFDFYDFLETVKVILESSFQKLFTFFKHTNKILVFVTNIVVIGFILGVSTRTVLKVKGQKKITSKSTMRLILSSLLFSSCLNVVFLLQNWIMYILFAVMLAVVAILNTAVNDNEKPIDGLKNGLNVLLIKLMESILLWFMIVIIVLLFSIINTSTIVVWLIDFISQNFVMDGDAIYRFYTFSSAFLGVGVFCLIFPIFFISFSLQYYSNMELKTATYLKKKIEILFP